MIKVEIITPERVVHTTEGDEILLPTVEGQVGILKNHLPLITLLRAGQIVVKRGNSEEVLAVAGGFVEVAHNTVRILADTAERAEELDEKRIQEAIDLAKQRKAEAADQHEYSSAAAAIEANLARMKAVQRRKSRSHRQSLPND